MTPPALLRLAALVASFIACAWAFATGHMVLAIPLVILSGWLFHRHFLAGIDRD